MRSLLVAALLALTFTACAPETPTCDRFGMAQCDAAFPQCLPDGWRWDCPGDTESCHIVDSDGNAAGGVSSYPGCIDGEPVCSGASAGLTPTCPVLPD